MAAAAGAIGVATRNPHRLPLLLVLQLSIASAHRPGHRHGHPFQPIGYEVLETNTSGVPHEMVHRQVEHRGRARLAGTPVEIISRKGAEEKDENRIPQWDLVAPLETGGMSSRRRVTYHGLLHCQVSDLPHAVSEKSRRHRGCCQQESILGPCCLNRAQKDSLRTVKRSQRAGAAVSVTIK